MDNYAVFTLLARAFFFLCSCAGIYTYVHIIRAVGVARIRERLNIVNAGLALLYTPLLGLLTLAFLPTENFDEVFEATIQSVVASFDGIDDDEDE